MTQIARVEDAIRALARALAMIAGRRHVELFLSLLAEEFKGDADVRG